MPTTKTDPEEKPEIQEPKENPDQVNNVSDKIFPDHPRKDLTLLVHPNWPANRVVRSVCHVDVRDLELLSHQQADFIPLPESFVFEGIDVIPVQPLDKEVALTVELKDGGVLGSFTLKAETMERITVGDEQVAEGKLVKHGKLALCNRGDDITADFKGRLAFVIKGYTLEHWR